MTAQPETIKFVELIAAAADAKQGEDIVALDVSAPLGIVEAFVLVTGRNERNVQSIADEIEDQALKSGRKALRREGATSGAGSFSIMAMPSLTFSTKKNARSTASKGCGVIAP